MSGTGLQRDFAKSLKKNLSLKNVRNAKNDRNHKNIN